MDPSDLGSLMHRRTSGMTVDREKPVDRAFLETLVSAAQTAPNHRKTRPLHVAVLQGASRLAFGQAVAAVMATRGEEDHKVEKARTKYGRAPVVLVVGSAPGESELETAENNYAVAAGIQNMLLLIEAAGMTALWSSPVKGAENEMNSFCGFPHGSTVVGIVYLGWGTRETPPRDRPAPVVTWLG